MARLFHTSAREASTLFYAGQGLRAAIGLKLQITKRKAAIAVSVGVTVALVLSGVAYLTLLVPGANADQYGDPLPHCSTTVSGENVANNAIQSAINSASAGAVICVAGGVYPEQLTITQPLSLVGLGTFHNPTEIQPTSLVQTSTDPDTATPEYNIVLVGGGSSSISGVTISNIVVDGSMTQSTFTSCANDYEGVEFLNAGGTITGSTVQNILLPEGLAGCQPGLGIQVQTSASQSSSVTISNDQVLNYNKNGITCNDAGSTCDISQNTVSFYTPYSQYIAPNGIQVAYGAVGKVTGNTVTGNECDVGYPTGTCGPNLITQTASCGILTYESGAGTQVSGNNVGGRGPSQGNDIGICSASDSAAVTGNSIQNSRFAAIYEDDGTYSASNNEISGSPIGVAVVSDGYSATATTSNLNQNGFSGHFTALVQLISLSGAPYGGTNTPTPAVSLSLNGETETLSGGTSSSPSIANITGLGQQFFGGNSGP